MSLCIKREREDDILDISRNLIFKAKIPRPPNAFMIYANENRKIMAAQHPSDSNKEISKKLGSTWRKLDAHEKSKYFEKARAVDMEHKLKYPDYVYNPQEARMRKAMRDANRDRSIGASPMLPRPSARRSSSSHPGWPPSMEEPPHHMMSHLGPHPSSMLQRPSNCYTPHPNTEQYLSPSPSYPKYPQHQQQLPHHHHQQQQLNHHNQTPPHLQQLHHQMPPMPPRSVPPPPMGSSGSYHHLNPLAQLQQQTEMWHNYQDDIRPASTMGASYMMPEHPNTPSQHHRPYHHHQPSPPLSIPSPLNANNMHPLMTPPPSSTQLPGAACMPMTPPHSINSNLSMTPPHCNENLAPEEPIPPLVHNVSIASAHHMPPDEQTDVFKQEIDVLQPLMDHNVQQQLQLYETHYDDDVKLKKTSNTVHTCLRKQPAPKIPPPRPLSGLPHSVTPQQSKHTTNTCCSRELVKKHLHNMIEEKCNTEDAEIIPTAIIENIAMDECCCSLDNISHLDFITTPMGYLPIAFIDNVQHF